MFDFINQKVRYISRHKVSNEVWNACPTVKKLNPNKMTYLDLLHLICGHMVITNSDPKHPPIVPIAIDFSEANLLKYIDILIVPKIVVFSGIDPIKNDPKDVYNALKFMAYTENLQIKDYEANSKAIVLGYFKAKNK